MSQFILFEQGKFRFFYLHCFFHLIDIIMLCVCFLKPSHFWKHLTIFVNSNSQHVRLYLLFIGNFIGIELMLNFNIVIIFFFSFWFVYSLHSFLYLVLWIHYLKVFHHLFHHSIIFSTFRLWRNLRRFRLFLFRVWFTLWFFRRSRSRRRNIWCICSWLFFFFFFCLFLFFGRWCTFWFFLLIRFFSLWFRIPCFSFLVDNLFFFWRLFRWRTFFHLFFLLLSNFLFHTCLRFFLFFCFHRFSFFEHFLHFLFEFPFLHILQSFLFFCFENSLFPIIIFCLIKEQDKDSFEGDDELTKGNDSNPGCSFLKQKNDVVSISKLLVGAIIPGNLIKLEVTNESKEAFKSHVLGVVGDFLERHRLQWLLSVFTIVLEYFL